MNRRTGPLPNRSFKKIITKWILWMISCGWLMLLMWLSSETAVATNETSTRLAMTVVRLLGVSADQTAYVNQLLRILAHIFGFFVFGVFFCCAVWTTWPHQKGVIIPCITICGILAVIDEVKKIFIPGRHLSFLEAGLNFAGAVFGVLISFYCIWLITRWRKNINHSL